MNYFRVIKKRGENQCRAQDLQNFNETILECGLQDTGFMGYKITWTNARRGTTNIQERLDRCLISQGGLKSIFSKIIVRHLARLDLNHAPIVIQANSNNGRRSKFAKPFRFEAMRIMCEDYENTIRQAWNSLPLNIDEQVVNSKINSYAKFLKS